VNYRLAGERHQKKNKAIKLTDSVKNYISEKLKEYWSPEQIMGRSYDVNSRNSISSSKPKL
jgi:IS30 family transposase